MLDIFRRLVVRNGRRTEADIQADVRQFILTAPFELGGDDLADVTMESPLGDRRRIDVEAGSTVIEVKRDLRKARLKQDAEEQLAGYVLYRSTQTGLRYVGVLTDGTEWNCYSVREGVLSLISQLTLSSSAADANRLLVWLEGVLATARNIPPTPLHIEQRLGTGSSAYELDRATLATLYAQHKSEPTVQVKRALWSQLLTSALGTQFIDSDALFIDHTLLINTSEIIAHAVLGLEIGSVDDPSELLDGRRFDEAGIYGVVEADFFDWVIEVEGGNAFVRTLAKRLARFEWADVSQDVLKVLYENFIGAETRKKMGEYYTPDWLAEAVVEEAITAPLSQRVLDPACGSGTFLFHAIRLYIREGEVAGLATNEILDGVTRHVIGMDLHPVAVTLARVTYLLALGKERLTTSERGDIRIPVYLGDAVQWREQDGDLWSAGNLVVHTEDLQSTLKFPDTLLEDSAAFDQLVDELANRASDRVAGSPPPSLRPVFLRLGVGEEFRQTIEATFASMCHLHDEGRNHIWGYYVRNLARPLWLSRESNRVDVIIGNPPWLAYRHMTVGMQSIFRDQSQQRGLWAGAELAPIQDLSALFVVRTCELYLRTNGRFAVVLPNTALDREQYAGFRAGSYANESGVLRLSFRPSWDLRRLRPHFFPRAASVVFGERRAYAETAGEERTAVRPHSPMPTDVEVWSGRLDRRLSRWSDIAGTLTRAAGVVRHVGQVAKSPYAELFTQGATFVPRVAFVVERQAPSALGLSRGRVAVRSSRSVQEKRPWKDVASLSGVVESQFLHSFFSGDLILPFSAGEPGTVVAPCNSQRMLSDEAIEGFPGLQQWWTRAGEVWNEHRSNERMTLSERLNFQATLEKQLPLAPIRVVYNKSGMHICGAKLLGGNGLVASGLYWAAVATVDEANFLCGILNAPVTTELTRPLMSYGKDERDIAKHVWELPIPLYNPADPLHRRVVELSVEFEQRAPECPITAGLHFASARRYMRDFLFGPETGSELDEIVFELIS